MRDRGLHSILEAFTREAASQLAAEAADGAEIPFELAQADPRPGRVPLYCYRPLTGEFIDSQLPVLARLPSYLAAARALAVVERVGAYLTRRGYQSVPEEPRTRAELALRALLRAVFADRSEFGFEPERFELAYRELEETLYEGQTLTTVIAPLLGLALDTTTAELPLGEGLSLIRADKLDGAPEQAIWGESGDPQLLAVLNVAHDPGEPPSLASARSRFRRLLSALRLFERGSYALAPVAWARSGGGAWWPVASGGSGRGGLPLLIEASQEDELRAFCSLVARRAPRSGRVGWALGRFELGAERQEPGEGLTDHLLALRALLEPEGPASGRLAWRVAAICVPPDQRLAATERVAAAVALEQELIAGASPSAPEADQLAAEIAEHLRALLRDIICGHLDPDPVPFADELLGATGDAPTAEHPIPLAVAAPHSAP